MRVFNKAQGEEAKQDQPVAVKQEEVAQQNNELELNQLDVIALMKFHSEKLAYLASLLTH